MSFCFARRHQAFANWGLFVAFFLCNDNSGEIHGKDTFTAGKTNRLVYVVEYVSWNA